MGNNREPNHTKSFNENQIYFSNNKKRNLFYLINIYLIKCQITATERKINVPHILEHMNNERGYVLTPYCMSDAYEKHGAFTTTAFAQ